MANSEKLIIELTNELIDLSSTSIDLQRRVPVNSTDYGIDKKAWIEETIEFLSSIKIDYYNL